MAFYTCRSLALAFSLALLSSGSAAALDRAELAEMEELLRDLGFNPGPVDGVVDAETTEAIRQYQVFAVLPGDPEPSARLLDELRGVAAAFAALNTGKTRQRAAPQIPELGAGAPSEPQVPEAESSRPQPATEKVIVPPPAPPPKLKPADEDEAAEAPPEASGAPPAAPQVAEIPPAAPEPPEEAEAPPPAALPQQEAALPAAPGIGVPEEADPVEAAQARIEAELAPYRQELERGSLSREELARRFNAEGRQTLQQSHYDAAVLKFSVAIHLDPTFAGAYSNRGTAYQQQDQADLAADDFAKARELGFGGLRIRDGSNPFN